MELVVRARGAFCHCPLAWMLSSAAVPEIHFFTHRRSAAEGNASFPTQRQCSCVARRAWEFRQNVDPLPRVDSTQMRPPCISTICLVMASPRPVRRPMASPGVGAGHCLDFQLCRHQIRRHCSRPVLVCSPQAIDQSARSQFDRTQPEQPRGACGHECRARRNAACVPGQRLENQR